MVAEESGRWIPDDWLKNRNDAEEDDDPGSYTRYP